jgi:hypothetical protein
MAEIPNFVRADVSDPTMRRFIEDPVFRQALLSDPAGTNQRDNLGLSPRTIDWIDERVRNHGLHNLLSGPVTEVVTY